MRMFALVVVPVLVSIEAVRAFRIRRHTAAVALLVGASLAALPGCRENASAPDDFRMELASARLLDAIDGRLRATAPRASRAARSASFEPTSTSRTASPLPLVATTGSRPRGCTMRGVDRVGGDGAAIDRELDDPFQVVEHAW